jgi:hypothetical protein
VILLGDVVSHLRGYIRRHWEALQASATKDPGLGMLMTLEKAERGHSAAGDGAHAHVRGPNVGSQHPRKDQSHR